MFEIVNVYWFYEGVKHETTAWIDTEEENRISVENTDIGIDADDLENCDAISLEEVWNEFLYQADDGEGGYDITNVELW